MPQGSSDVSPSTAPITIPGTRGAEIFNNLLVAHANQYQGFYQNNGGAHTNQVTIITPSGNEAIVYVTDEKLRELQRRRS
ncbi:MAG: hypothetical protein LBS83_01170 [Holosporales bacterium]|jgi:hypothetical protein|nr:hypothetical protein [Holosporales bacterium]